MGHRPRVKQFDVVGIPVGETGQWAIGHVLDARHNLFIGVHEQLVSDLEGDWLRTLRSPWVLLAPTMDALIWHGRWPVVGNSPPMNAVSLPRYAVDSLGESNPVLTDYFGNRLGHARAEDIRSSKVVYRFSVAPIRVQKAIAAWFGLGQWHDSYFKLTAEYVLESAVAQPDTR